MNLNNFLSFLDRSLTCSSSRLVMAWVLSGMVVIGVPDYLVGIDIPLTVFYILPVGIATWYVGCPAGLVAAFLSAIPAFIEYLHKDYWSDRPAILLWGLCLHISTMLIFATLLARLAVHIRRERAFARIDVTTGIANRRAFIEHLGYSLALLRREAIKFSVAYIDLDNFKLINDRYGHDEGDRVLCLIAQTLTRSARHNDLVARLGDDEFAMLVSGANRDQALHVLQKTKLLLRDTLAREGLRVTCSIGCVAVHAAQIDVDGIIKAADQLMYRIKHSGKDGVFVEEFNS